MKNAYVYEKGGKLHAVFRVDGKQVWRSLGLKATDENMLIAKDRLPQVYDDYLNGKLPSRKHNYKKPERDAEQAPIVKDSNIGINNADVERIVTEKLSAFTENIKKDIENRMNMMSNSFEYIIKLLENSGLAAPTIDREKVSWQVDVKNLIHELVQINKIKYPTYNSVIVSVCLRLRDVYGIVMEQLRKEYKSKYDIDYTPDILDIVADTEIERKLFESILRSLFPRGYWDSEPSSEDMACVENSKEETLREIVRPLAERYGDTSDGYDKTLGLVYQNMDCAWSNLKKRFMRINNLKTEPRKETIVINNPNVLRKFKKSVTKLLDVTVSL